MTPTPIMQKTGVRCPHCGAKLAEQLDGVAVILCRKCRDPVTIQRHDPIPPQTTAA